MTKWNSACTRLPLAQRCSTLPSAFRNETNTNTLTACNGTIVADSEMGEVIQLQGDQRKDVQDFLVDKKEGLELDPKTIKVHGF